MIVPLASEVVSIHFVRILMTISQKASLGNQSSLCSVCFFVWSHFLEIFVYLAQTLSTRAFFICAGPLHAAGG